MADVLNKISTLTELDDVQIEKALLNRLLPRLRAYQDGQKSILKKNTGTQIEWTRFEALADSTTEATEGVTPEAEALDPTPITATVKQYVRGIKLTDRLLARGKHKCRAEAVRLLSEAGAKTIDSLVVAEMLKATKVYFGNNKAAATIAAADTVKESDIEKMFVYLADNNVPRFEDDTYHALVTPKMASDIRKLSSFVDKAKYQDPKGETLVKGEIGTVLGIKFIESTNIPTAKHGASGSLVDCEQLIAYGPDAYGVVDVEDEGSRGKPKMIHKGLGSAGTDDYADQRASEATKFEFAAKILDEKRICVLKAPASITL